MDERKGSKGIFRLVAALGGLLIVVSVAGMILMGVGRVSEEKSEPVHLFYAEGAEEYSYIEIQCMTDYVAEQEYYTNLYYYIAFDAAFYPMIIALTEDKVAEYQEYIDWTYYGTDENIPAVQTVTGYSQPFEPELQKIVMETYNEIYGGEYVTSENFAEYFGNYFICPGKGNDAFKNFNFTVYGLVIGVVLLTFGMSKMNVAKEETPEEKRAHRYEPEPKPNRMAGIFGALIGATMGMLLWASLGALGWISGWIGVLMVMFAYTGYKLLAKKGDRFGWILSVVMSLILVIPSTYLGSVWGYYQEMNKNMPGFYSFVQALKFFPDYLVTYDAVSELVINTVIGYVFVVVSIGRHELSVIKTWVEPQQTQSVSYYNNNYGNPETEAKEEKTE